MPERSSKENCSEKLIKIPRVISVAESLFGEVAELKLKILQQVTVNIQNYLRR